MAAARREQAAAALVRGERHRASFSSASRAVGRELLERRVLRELQRPHVRDDRPAVLDRQLRRVGGHEAEAVGDDPEDVAVRDVAVGVERGRPAQRHVERHLALAVAEDAVAGGADDLEAGAAAGEESRRSSGSGTVATGRPSGPSPVATAGSSGGAVRDGPGGRRPHGEAVRVDTRSPGRPCTSAAAAWGRAAGRPVSASEQRARAAAGPHRFPPARSRPGARRGGAARRRRPPPRRPPPRPRARARRSSRSGTPRPRRPGGGRAGSGSSAKSSPRKMAERRRRARRARR